MNNQTLHMLDIVYFLVSQHGYEQVKLSPNDNDFWLFNRNHKKFKVIRLTTESMSMYKENKDIVVQKAKKVGDLFNQDVDLLNIHFTDEDTLLFFEPGYYQAQVNEASISPLLLEQFPKIRTALLPIQNDFKNEMDFRQSRFEAFNKQRFENIKRKSQSKTQKKTFGWTHILIAINVLVFIVGIIISSKTNSSFSSVFMGALYKPLVYGAMEWWRVITSAFVHADFLHLLVNMLAFSQLGMLVERVYGKKQMLFIFFISVITSSLLVLANEAPRYITLGASGGIFGLMGAVIVYLFSSGLYKIPAVRNNILMTLGINLVISFLPGVSLYGHLGGLIGGALAALIVSKAHSVKSAFISSIVSLSFIIIGLFGYTIFFDQNLYPVNPELDKTIIAGYLVLGFEKHAENLFYMYEDYYEVIGEEFIIGEK